MLVDQDIRIQALNPKKSFIVTAPAGSGKTYLLTRRILNLMLTVEDPSHIVSITFTKKAALEMRERVAQCLINANEPISIKVLERSKEKSWDILNNIDSLSIMTIDSFCAWLLSKGKPQPLFQISQNPFHIYQTIIYDYYNTPAYSKSQTQLIKAFGQYQQLESLLSSLLSQRDQWKNPLNQQDITSNCQAGIEYIITQSIDSLQQKLQPIQSDIEQLFIYHDKIASSMDEPVIFAATNTQKKLEHLATLCLTTTGNLRKTLNKRQGIYSKAKASQTTLNLQDQFKTHYAHIQEFITDNNLSTELQDIQKLPITQSIEEQSFLAALSDVLNSLLTRLHNYFIQHQTCDFIYISLESIQSLEKDSVLQSFCQSSIHHLLVDEFQDTSQSQYQLLENLISLWPQDEKRTLFAVGDPMQSIYRFRQADLSLFIKLQSEPISYLQLTPIALVSNFRSSSQLIDIINNLFPEIFPKKASSFYCGIPYNQAATTQPSQPEDTIYLHLEASDDMRSLAQLTINRLQSISNNHPNDSIAILVQARSHLKHIIPLLEAEKIPFNAIDIYPTLSLSAISDLCALQSALIDPYDRLSLFIALRSPLCGLDLENLSQIPQNLNNLSILKENLNNPYFIKFKNAFLSSLNESNPVYQTWHIWKSLLGDKLYPKTQATAIENWFTQTLKRYEEGFPLDRLSLLDHFSKSYNSVIQPHAKINLLTAHKSKGLEFDHVIIPHIEKKKPQASTPLFYCEHSQLPIIQPTFSQNQQNIDYFKYINKRRDQYENHRLLYVASTRAKSTLHFITHENEINNTWLSILHPLIKAHPKTKISHYETQAPNTSQKQQLLLRTLEHDIITPELKPISQNIAADAADIGTALHYFMQNLHSPNRDQKWQYYIHQHNLDESLLTYSQKILLLQDDPLFKWITQSYQWERNEFSLSYLNEHYILDRVFLYRDTLWIIDYKFPTHPLSNDILLEQYRKQLEQYKKALFQYIPKHPIKTALYLPLENRLIESIHKTANSTI